MRRGQLAQGSVASPEDQLALTTLAKHHLRKARGDRGAAKALIDSAHRYRKKGRGELVAFVASTLAFDGGRLVRQLAAATRGKKDAADAADAAIAWFARTAYEHNVQGGAALGLLLRAALQGAILDRALVRQLAGDPDAEDAAKLDASARVNTVAAMQLAAATPPGEDRARGEFLERVTRENLARRAAAASALEATAPDEDRSPPNLAPAAAALPGNPGSRSPGNPGSHSAGADRSHTGNPGSHPPHPHREPGFPTPEER